MTIAVIGWGSLVWDPRDLDIELTWCQDGPRLPVEFSRVSLDSRLTLVLVEDVPVQTTLWAVNRKATLEEAAKDLQAREGCGARGIGTWPRLEHRSRVTIYDEIVNAWVAPTGLDGVVWTALGPTDRDKRPGWMSETERLEYLKGLVAAGKAEAARKYIECAPAQIETSFRVLVRRELGWGKG